MAQKHTKIIVSLFFSFFIIFFSCEDKQEISDRSSVTENNENIQTNENTQISSIDGLPPGIPSFPHIFSGNFYIADKIGPDNAKIYAKLGELDSPVVVTKNGKFDNLIIGPRSEKDVENNIEFFILNDDGTSMKAKEEIPFEITPVIKSNIIDLHFK